MPLINTPAQGNQAQSETLTSRETMLAEALLSVLVATGMIRADAYVSPEELLLAAADYVVSQEAEAPKELP